MNSPQSKAAAMMQMLPLLTTRRALPSHVHDSTFISLFMVDGKPLLHFKPALALMKHR